MAYILSKEQGHGKGSEVCNASAAQKAVWTKWATFKEQFTSFTTVSAMYTQPYTDIPSELASAEKDQILSEAATAASNTHSISSPDATGLIADVNGHMACRMSYSGTISSIVVTYAEGSPETIDANNCMSSNIQFYKDGDFKNRISITDIPKDGSYFYIANTSEKIMTNMQFNVPCSIQTATIYILSSGARQQLIAVKIGSSETNVSVTIPVNESGNLKIAKKDSKDTNANLSGVAFKIKSVTLDKWLINNNGTFSYGDESSASEFTTDSNGEISLQKLKCGVYNIYETKTINGYNIEDQTNGTYIATSNDGKTENKAQNGYDSNKKMIDIGTVSVCSKDYGIKVLTINNDKIVDKISGMVWVDEPDQKGNDTDKVYKTGTNDTLFEGMTVKLYTGTAPNGTLIASTKTDSNGHYEFTEKNEVSDSDKRIFYSDLVNAYVEFEYDNKTYIVVDSQVGDDVTVNSKAQEYTMEKSELDDSKLTGEGKAITNPANGTLYTYYNDSTYSIENINLGIREKHDPTYNVNESLEYIKVKMNGYTYTYKYGEKAVATSYMTPTTTMQLEAKKYTAKIYPSDIAYNVAENKEELQVYVVYKVGVENNETVNINSLYKEQKLYLNSLTNKYDTDRYTLCNDENNNDSSDFALWTSNNDGTISYDVNNEKSAYKDGIASLETKTSLVQFKIKEAALEKLLTKTVSDEDVETSPTISNASAYHEYLRTDNVWVAGEKAYEGAKNTSPESGYYVHKSVSEDMSSSALYIGLQLGETRTITGKVFEDTDANSSDNEAIGNGMINDSETSTAGRNVKVELLNTDKSTVSSLYQKKDGTAATAKDAVIKTTATTTTNDNGTYTLAGIVPGYYYIRFTYGDGTQKLYTTTGTLVDLKSNDYKSTIINTSEAGATIKNAMEASADTINGILSQKDYTQLTDAQKQIVEWYKKISDNYSVATDDLTQRAANADTVYSEGESISSANIDAYTPIFGISIENDENTSSETSTESNTQKYLFSQFNFGVITTAKTVLTPEKVISNVKLTAQTGTTLVNANPADKSAQYITALDNLTNGSKYTKAEIESDLLYGTQLETTYTITLTNDSQENYSYDDYQKYGIIPDEEKANKAVVAITPELKDYLDEKYDWSSVNVTTSEGVTYGGAQEETTTDSDGNEVTTKYEEFTTNWELKSGDSQTVATYTVSDLLSSEEDLEYENDVKVTSLGLSLYGSLQSDFEWKDDSTTITLTPPTGADKSNTYWVAAVIGLIAIAGGFVLIKKRVLK